MQGKIPWGKTDADRAVWKEGLGLCLEGRRWNTYSELPLDMSSLMTVRMLIFGVWV